MSGRPPDPADVAAGFACSCERPLLANGSLSEPSFKAMVFPLSEKLAFAADDRQVDELRPGVVGRRIADEEAAQIDVLHLLHRADERLARQVLARPPQPFDEYLRGEETLDRAEVVGLEAGLFRHHP